MVQTILMQSGYRTVCAFDATQALTRISQDRPDLVLLDVQLPDGNGLDICHSMQRNSATLQTPVLFMSSDDDIATKVQGFEAGAVDYITKPVSGPEILARVGTHLRLKRAYESLAELVAERILRLANAQETLLPQPDDLPKARLCVTRQQVLKAGGDVYDVIPMGECIVDYVVADASGHDLAASFWTASLKTLLGEYAHPTTSPLEIVFSINRALLRILPEGVFFTLIFARLNRGVNQLTLVSAGHPPAILVPKNGDSPRLVQEPGDVIGAFSDVAFGVSEVKVATGDRVMLFTDGLLELGGSAESGMEKLVDACAAYRTQPLKTMVQSIVSQRLNVQEAQDDIVLMGVEV